MSSITFATKTHRATIASDNQVQISTWQDGHGWVWAGTGRWTDGRIEADLGDEVYTELEAGLRKCIG